MIMGNWILDISKSRFKINCFWAWNTRNMRITPRMHKKRSKSGYLWFQSRKKSHEMSYLHVLCSTNLIIKIFQCSEMFQMLFSLCSRSLVYSPLFHRTFDTVTCEAAGWSLLDVTSLLEPAIIINLTPTKKYFPTPEPSSFDVIDLPNEFSFRLLLSIFYVSSFQNDASRVWARKLKNCRNRRCVWREVRGASLPFFDRPKKGRKKERRHIKPVRLNRRSPPSPSHCGR